MSKSSLFEQLCSSQVLLDAWKSVKSKNAAGGIDGISFSLFDKDIGSHITSLLEELRRGRWSPSPYLRVDIPKKDHEKRQLGLLTIKDKIVQQAIASLLQPRFERLFVNNSYGYRLGKGPVKAIRRAASLCGCKRNTWVLRLDIDNFFDTIDHTILFSRLQHVVPDPEVLRLIQLCVQMGTVTTKNHWQQTAAGVPQGAVISPLLSNFYLHPFDQFILSKSDAYVRYADDFMLCCSSQEIADQWLTQISSFRQSAQPIQPHQILPQIPCQGLASTSPGRT